MHLASLPVDDLVENAVVVNALQRAAHVVVQKSLAEGFGLTVTEAMWKERPVIASRVGGIQDQIVDGESGVLVDPTDLVAYGDAVADLLRDQLLAVEIGHGARARVRERFLAPHFLSAHLELMDRVIAAIRRLIRSQGVSPRSWASARPCPRRGSAAGARPRRPSSGT